MEYLYETHLHTNQVSACGRSSGAEHVRYYHSIGYTGIFVTDHFFRGNCRVPRLLPWRQRIDLFRKGFDDAWNEGQKCGLDVFFAWEETHQGDDYLIYGPSPEWLAKHPEAEHWTHREQYEAIHEAGGCVVQAHPFRCREYISMITLAPDYVDAIETANAGNEQIWDAAAMKYARAFDFYCICGSDIHYSCPGILEKEKIFGVGLDYRIGSAFDFAQHILKQKPIRLYVPKGRYELTGEALPLNVYWIDGKERRTPAREHWTSP